VLGCPWQRCSVHFLREALGHARREQQTMLAAVLRPLFSADSGEAARELVGDALEACESRCRRWPRPCSRRPSRICSPSTPSPPDPWPKLRSTNPLKRVNREIGRRNDVVGIFPNDASLIRLAASVVSSKTTNGSSASATSQPARWKAVIDQEKTEDKQPEGARELNAA
jgi:putative transposase